MIITRRKFMRRSVETLAAAAAGGFLRPNYLMAQANNCGIGGNVRFLIEIFLYGGADTLYFYPPTDGPQRASLDAFRPNLNGELNYSQVISLPGMDQGGRQSPIGFHPEFQKFTNSLQSTGCGVSVTRSYGVTGDSSRSHRVAQQNFTAGSDGDPKAFAQGWLPRLIDAAGCPFASVWGVAVDDPLKFNSTINKPAVISSFGGVDFADRNFGSFNCSTCEGSGHYVDDGRDTAFAREIAKRIMDETSDPEQPFEQAVKDTVSGVHSTVGIANDISQLLNSSADQQRFQTLNNQNTSFGNRMRDICRAILYLSGTQTVAGSTPPNLGGSTLVFSVGTGGHDTHSDQRTRAGGSIRAIAGALSGTIETLSAAGLLNQTLIMMHGEFGRTVTQNGSYGTDHGNGSDLLLVGGGVRRAFHGPDLTSEQLIRQNYVPAEVPFTGVMKQVLAQAGFNPGIMSTVFPNVLPGETTLPLFT